MKAFYTTLFVSIFFIFTINCQVINWNKKFGIESVDDRAFDLIETENNNLIACGFKTEFYQYLGYDTIFIYDQNFEVIGDSVFYGTLSISNKQAFVTKLSLNGDTLNNISLGGIGNDEAIKVVEYDNNFFVAANSFSDTLTTSFGKNDISFYVLNNSLQLQNSYKIGGAADDFISDFMVVENKIYFTGYSESIDFLDTIYDNFDLFYGIFDLQTLDYEIFSFGGSNDDNGKNILMVNNEIIILGDTKSNNINVSNNFGASDVWLLKIEKDTGNLLFEKNFGGSSGEIAVDFLYDENKFYFLAETASNNIDISTFYGSGDFWLVHLNNNFDIIWDNTFGGSLVDNPQSLFLQYDKILVAGATFSNNGTIENSIALIDSWIASVNKYNGNLINSFTIGGNDFDFVYKAIATSQNQIVVAGYSDSPIIETAKVLHLNHNFWVASIDTTLVNIYNYNNLQSAHFKIVTTENGIILKNNIAEKQTITLVNLNGAVIKKINLLPFEEQEINKKQFAKGNYIFGNGIYFTKVAF